MLKPQMAKDWQNKIDLFSLENKKIVYTHLIDNSIFWVHNLTQKKELVFLDEDYAVYDCYEHGFYIVYLISDSGKDLLNLTLNHILKLTDKNYVHCILSDSKLKNDLVDIFEKTIDSNNFNYSILNINSEILTEKEPFDLFNMPKMKYFFACTNIIGDKRKTASEWSAKNVDKLQYDFKYSLTYFYHKFGFCYYQKGNQPLEISNRENKVFLYSKHSGEHTERYRLVKKAIDTERIQEKPYTTDDWFWYFVNYNYYHMPFFTDYNTCKFNLVMETQPPNELKEYSNLFLSEKTLKALMVSTPTYVLLQYPVYQNLKEAGFYFLNEEFGKYDNSCDILSNGNTKAYDVNYDNFCEWLTNCSDIEFNEMFEKTYKRSINNKSILESYLNSDKEKEINLLINS
jgi:hypothetical protein